MSRDSDDQERTVTGPVARDGAASEFAASSSMSVHTLPEGTRIRDYKITGLIGEGGFGIVYLAFDVSLQRRVAIKEYLPASMASRANTSMAVVVKSARHQETFALGLKSFLNEARLLARFDHPSLVKVYRFWEENNTAYMVMPYYEGPTLKKVLADLGHAPDEAALRTWLRPLLDALAVMHAAHCFHRDIAPDNILLTASGPLLLDFGAARRVIGDMTHALTVVLKPGFAPIEQYGESSAMTQGAWTDLYALASVVYAAVTGHAPVSSVERLMDDRLQPLSELAAGRYSEPFLTAIDAALALRPKDRPQTVAAFRALLDGREAQAEPSVGFASTFAASLDSALPEATLPPASALCSQIVAPDITLDSAPMLFGTAAKAPAGRGRVYAILGTLSLLGLAAAGFYFGGERGTRPVAEPAVEAAAPAASIAAAVPAPTPTPAPAPAQAIVRAPTPTAAAPAPVREPPATASAAPAESQAQREPRIAERRGVEPRPVAAEPAPKRVAERPAAPTITALPKARCSDILQKASLEPLTASEAEFLKKECR
ncbi:MAG: serine/threonine-protein kinase [Burkholderiales bacterium]